MSYDSWDDFSGSTGSGSTGGGSTSSNYYTIRVDSTSAANYSGYVIVQSHSNRGMSQERINELKEQEYDRMKAEQDEIENAAMKSKRMIAI